MYLYDIIQLAERGVRSRQLSVLMQMPVVVQVAVPAKLSIPVQLSIM
jgi:hypothetical protein